MSSESILPIVLVLEQAQKYHEALEGTAIKN